MACADLGVCGCTKDGVTAEQLDGIYVVTHWKKSWRRKKCPEGYVMRPGQPGQPEIDGQKKGHNCHRDRNAVEAFMLMLRVEAQYHGRVDAHCHRTHATSPGVAAPVTGRNKSEAERLW